VIGRSGDRHFHRVIRDQVTGDFILTSPIIDPQ